jgi:uncharacterized protein (UPF0261 family)
MMRDDAPAYDPELDRTLVSELRLGVGADVRIVGIDANINDGRCARAAVSQLHQLMNEGL